MCIPRRFLNQKFRIRSYGQQFGKLVLFTASIVTFLVAGALALDGYFVDHERFVYEFFTFNSSGDVNVSFFATFSRPLTDVWFNGTPSLVNGTETLWVNFTRSIAPGAFANETWTLMIPGYSNVSGFFVVSCRFILFSFSYSPDCECVMFGDLAS